MTRCVRLERESDMGCMVGWHGAWHAHVMVKWSMASGCRWVRKDQRGEGELVDMLGNARG